MTQPGDSFALILILGIIFYFVVRRWLPLTFTEWLTQSSNRKKEAFSGKVPKLLEKDGYELYGGKEKIPMTIMMDDDEYQSRLYVDYIVKKEDDWYLVFVERARRPLKSYGPGLRDFFLSYYLLYKPSGILYVKKDQTIHRIDFDIEDQRLSKDTRKYWFYLIFFLLGMIVTLLTQ